MKNDWQDLRASWVNGNRTAVLGTFRKMRKPAVWLTLNQALNDIAYSIPRGTPLSGDLQDLLEITTKLYFSDKE